MWPQGLGAIGGRVGSSGTNTCDSRVFCRRQQKCSNSQSRWQCAEAGATTSQTTARSRLASRELRRQEAGFDEKARGRLSVDEWGRDGLNSPCAGISTFRPVPNTARSISFFGTEEKGNRLEGSGNQSTFEGVVTEWAKALRLPWTAAAGRHTETRDRRAHHHERESSCHRFFFCVFLRRQDIRRWMLYELVRFRAYNSPIVECIFAA